MKIRASNLSFKEYISNLPSRYHSPSNGHLLNLRNDHMPRVYDALRMIDSSNPIVGDTLINGIMSIRSSRHRIHPNNYKGYIGELIAATKLAPYYHPIEPDFHILNSLVNVDRVAPMDPPLLIWPGYNGYEYWLSWKRRPYDMAVIGTTGYVCRLEIKNLPSLERGGTISRRHLDRLIAGRNHILVVTREAIPADYIDLMKNIHIFTIGKPENNSAAATLKWFYDIYHNHLHELPSAVDIILNDHTAQLI